MAEPSLTHPHQPLQSMGEPTKSLVLALEHLLCYAKQWALLLDHEANEEPLRRAEAVLRKLPGRESL